MPETYLESIIKYLADKNYRPLKLRQLARRMGVEDNHYAAFRDAVKQLRDAGRVVYGPKNDLSLPPIPARVVGAYRANPRGFGFVIPDEPNAHGDLYIPDGANLDAITGDTVVARVKRGGKRGGKTMYQGQIIEILARGKSRFVGELDRAVDRDKPLWFVMPQGRTFTDPIVIDDVGPDAALGKKVVVEIVHFPSGTDLARGVIVEVLGKGGPAEIETLAMIREHGLPDEFSDEAVEDARRAIRQFDADGDPTREDFTDWTICTIDPETARDYDDAISIHPLDGGGWTLGVHIADVAHFVGQGCALDEEAYDRGNSAYFPRKVVPMLPEILSNGVCSLQEGQVRFVKSALIDYDRDGNVLGARLANGKIRSCKRLTYKQAQGILDGHAGGYAPEVVELVRTMNTLARRIEQRRKAAGMLHLDLPEKELILSDDGEVAGVKPVDDSYTHTIIEMFMVEANEAAARLLDRLNVAFLRRIHPERDPESGGRLRGFIRACGHKVPTDMSRADIQALVDRVKGRPESYAVNLALLKTFESAEYSPMRVGHYALASDCYCHFTSPIRRYPDLTVHRLLDEHIRHGLNPEQAPDASEVASVGEHCSFTERRAAAAERDLYNLLVLIHLSKHVGSEFEGVVTGVTSFGLFVQSSEYLVEGLIRLEDLGDDWWEPNPSAGEVTAQRSGARIRLGDALKVRIAGVDLARREMELALAGGLAGRPRKKSKAAKGKAKGNDSSKTTAKGKAKTKAKTPPQPKAKAKAKAKAEAQPEPKPKATPDAEGGKSKRATSSRRRRKR